MTNIAPSADQVIYRPGEALFVPRDTVHALANLHTGSATVVAVAIK